MIVTLKGLLPNPVCLLGNFVSTKYNLSGGYMPSFQKKEVGSVGQRIQLAPLAGQHTSRPSPPPCLSLESPAKGYRLSCYGFLRNGIGHMSFIFLLTLLTTLVYLHSDPISLKLILAVPNLDLHGTSLITLLALHCSLSTLFSSSHSNPSLC